MGSKFWSAPVILDSLFMGEVGKVRTLSSSGISLEVAGDLETATGIWEEANYCLPVSLSPSSQLEQMGSWLAGSVYVCVCTRLVLFLC